MNFDTGALGASMDWVKKLEGALGGDHPALRRGKLPLELSIYAFVPNRIAVVSVQGRESVNEAYQYEVEVVTPFPPEIFQLAAFGRSATLLLRTAEHDARKVQGAVAALEVCGVADRGLGKDLFRYVLTLVPPMWAWTQRRRNRIFQHKSVVEVVKSMLEADKIHHRLRLLEEEYPKRPLYYQRDETDYEFFKRILAEAGIYFFFEHAVQDSLAKGVVGDVGTGAAVVAATGAGLAGAGGMIGGGFGDGMGAMGGPMSSVGGKVEEVTHAVTCLVLADGADGATPLQDFAAISDLANQAMKKAVGAAVGALGVPKGVSNAVDASVGFDASDAITMDDGTAAAAGDERAYSFVFRRSLRPKSAWTLERDQTVPESWAHRERVDAVSASKLSLDFHMSLGRNGVGTVGGASLKMDVEAPEIPAEKLEQELIARNAGWLRYPSERNAKETADGRFTDKHPHLGRPLEQLRRDRAVAMAETDCRRLGAGYRFTLQKHPAAALNAEYIVTELSVEAFDADMLDLDPKDPRRDRPYSAKLECVPNDVAPRPPLPEKKKLGMELGTVVRWEESMDMVALARGEVLVRLHWDTDHKGFDRKYPTSSKQHHRDRVLRIPVMQPWAGDGYGLQVIPRDGMQVVIGYLDDQGDRPVILGCLHNDAAPPAWSGWDAQKVGFRSKSRWPNGTMADDGMGWTTGWSEISISDTGENERITIRAQKDLVEEVVADRTESVGGDTSLSVGGDAETEIDGMAIYAVAGAANFSAKSNAKLRVSQDCHVQIEHDHTLAVGGDQTERVTGNASSTVLGNVDITHSANHHAFFKGDYVERHSGHRTVIVGQHKNERSATLHVEGSSSAYSSGTVDIVADEGLTIRCGDSHLIIKKDAITLQSPTIALVAKTMELTASDKLSAGSKQVEVGGTDSVAVTGKKTTLSGDSSSVVLDSNATVQGSSVKLGSGSGASANKKDEKKAKITKIKLVDQDGKPLANQRVVLRKGGEGGPERVVVLDKDGKAEVEGDETYDVKFPELPGAKAK